MKIEIVEATIDHALDLAPRLRQDDKWEIMCSCGLTSVNALTQAVQFSKLAWTALLDGRPEIMWGAAEFPPDHSMGIAWLLSSEEMYKIPGRFQKEAVIYLNKLFETFDTLFNYVAAVNIKSQRWLEVCGFTAVGRDEHYGVGKQPFILYSRTI